MTPLSRRLIWTFVIGVAVSLAALIASSDQDAIATLLKHDIGSLALKLALVIFAGGLVLTLFRERLSQALEAMVFWAVVGLLLVVGYSYRFELREVGDRVIAELVPGHVAGHGRHVEVVRGRGGDFAVARAYQRRARADGARYRRDLGGAHPATRPRQPACRSKCSTIPSTSTPPTAAPARRR